MPDLLPNVSVTLPEDLAAEVWDRIDTLLAPSSTDRSWMEIERALAQVPFGHIRPRSALKLLHAICCGSFAQDTAGRTLFEDQRMHARLLVLKQVGLVLDESARSHARVALISTSHANFLLTTQLLLDMGATSALAAMEDHEPLSSPSFYEYPLLSYVVALTDPCMTALFLANGALVNEEDSKGLTALFYSCEHFGLEHMRLLLDTGANPNHRSHTGDTPLSLVHSLTPQQVQLLVDHGADWDLPNNEGKTPLDLALECQSEGAQLLLALAEHAKISAATPDCADHDGDHRRI